MMLYSKTYKQSCLYPPGGLLPLIVNTEYFYARFWRDSEIFRQLETMSVDVKKSTIMN